MSTAQPKPPLIHYELTHEERARRLGRDPAHMRGCFSTTQMICGTGDGHAKGTRVLKNITCGSCIKALAFVPYA